MDSDARTITILVRRESRFEVAGIYGEGQTLRSPTLAGFTIELASWDILKGGPL